MTHTHRLPMVAMHKTCLTGGGWERETHTVSTQRKTSNKTTGRKGRAVTQTENPELKKKKTPTCSDLLCFVFLLCLLCFVAANEVKPQNISLVSVKNPGHVALQSVNWKRNGSRGVKPAQNMVQHTCYIFAWSPAFSLFSLPFSSPCSQGHALI